MNVSPHRAEIVPVPTEEAMLNLVRTLCRRRLIWLEHLAQIAARDPALAPASGRALADVDAPGPEAEFLARHPEAQALSREAAAQESWLFETDRNRWRHLSEVFDLTEPERRLVLVCLALAIDPSLGLVFGTLSGIDRRANVTEPLAARLFGLGRTAMWGPASPLSRWQILESGEDAGTLQLNSYVLSYLRGASDVDPGLTECCIVINEVPEPFESWPIQPVARSVDEGLRRGMPARVQVIGQRLSGRRTFAATVSLALGRPLSVVDTDRIADRDWSQTLMQVQRQALLHRSAVAWAGEQAAQGLEVQPGVMDLEFTILETEQEISPSVGWHEERVRIPALTVAQRRALWQRYLPVTQAWPEAQVAHLADRFQVTIGEILYVAGQGAATFDEVQRRTRNLSHGKLGDLARLLDCPFSRDDLHLPGQVGELLDEFLFEARVRNRFWEKPEARRLFPRGVGLIGLLSGPPGTGKTMAAQVVAAELGLDLFRIDVATTVDKYIGETAKRLKRLFARASEINAVLLCDEADALFSKRTDTKDSLDRHANADTSYLLQLVEDYPGVALLATNKRQQIDDAFVRRIRYVFYLPRPERQQRLAIWRQVLSALTDPETAAGLDEEILRLAEDVPMTGAQIKNTALAAVFLAERDGAGLTRAHLDRAIERQLINQGGNLATERKRIRR